MEWLILLAVLGLAAGFGGGYALGARNGSGARRVRELEAELDGARRELEDYRQEVVHQFKETARKFQTLNDSYTDLHQQLARSSSVLCAGVTGALLAAPAGHHDLLSAEARDGTADGRAGDAAATNAAATDAADPEAGEPPTLRERVARSATTGADGQDIRVPEPMGAEPVPADAQSASIADESTPADDERRPAVGESANRAGGRSGRG